jgi:hypothetical protein
MGPPIPEIACKICGKSVDLWVDPYADESGRSVHEDCYLMQIARSVTQTLRTQWEHSRLCPVKTHVHPSQTASVSAYNFGYLSLRNPS